MHTEVINLMRDKCEMCVLMFMFIEEYSIYVWMRVQLPLSSIVVISRSVRVSVL